MYTYVMRGRRAVLALCCVCLLAGCVGGIGLTYDEDPELFPKPPKNAITFWGHACMYVDVDGFGIVTDPVFEPVYATFHRRYIDSPPPSSFAGAGIVLISHAHNDHLSPKTLKRFPESTIVLCPIPSAKYLDELKVKIITMRPGDVQPFPGGEIIAVDAWHPGYRYSYKAKADGRALGYIIRTPERTIYYTGDTRYFDVFREVGIEHKPDVVLINVNTHLEDHESLKAIRDLNPRRVIPGHFGAYRGSNERKTPKYRKALADDLGSMWVELAVGESATLDGDRIATR